MNVLIISASPRKDGNSSYIASALSEKYSGENVDTVHLVEEDFSTCTACYSCRKNNTLCVIKDGLEDIYPKILAADLIIFISPNYYNMITGLAKVFLDRWYCLKDDARRSKFEEGKKMFFLFVQGSPNSSHGQMMIDWSKRFFESFNLKYYGLTIPNCKVENTDGPRMKIDDIKLSLNMFA